MHLHRECAAGGNVGLDQDRTPWHRLDPVCEHQALMDRLSRSPVRHKDFLMRYRNTLVETVAGVRTAGGHTQ